MLTTCKALCVAHSVLYMLFQHLLQIVHICTVVQKRTVNIAMSHPKKHKHLFYFFSIIALTKEKLKIALRLKYYVRKMFAVQSAPFCSFIGDITVLALCFLLNKLKWLQGCSGLILMWLHLFRLNWLVMSSFAFTKHNILTKKHIQND